ncbi:MAG: 2-oxo acid dehydrogenase subunit E2 [Anaerolineae bacterium]|nr:2-oxo acid dehydrogenase subunit E2 [Anaerolineae bacterium]
MAREILMPQLGADMTEGTLLNWLKQPGDQVQPGDIIAEVESDKATIEVPVESGGTILELKGQPGDALTVGSVIGTIGEAGESAPAPAKAAPVEAAQPAPAAEKQTNGAATAEAEAVDAPPAPPTPEPVAEANGDYPDGIKASPIARRIAAERGIDLRQVRGSGPAGRIVKSDIEGYVAPPAPKSAPAPQATPAPAIAGQTWGTLPQGPDVEIIDVTRLRSRIATRMIQSKQQVPHFYVTSAMDTQALLALRVELNNELPDDQKITVNDLIIKAAGLTLVDFPNLNTHFYGDKLVRYKRINIGIAVALPNGGLMNVVAKDVDKTSIGVIARRNKEMIGRAREGKVKPEDLEGSTFTVSNLGAYDVEHFLAIINPPEAAILAVGTAKKIPVVLADGTLGVGNQMKVTISVDHRVSDGAEGAQYMQKFKALIENPMRLLI